MPLHLFFRIVVYLQVRAELTRVEQLTVSSGLVYKYKISLNNFTGTNTLAYFILPSVFKNIYDTWVLQYNFLGVIISIAVQ